MSVAAIFCRDAQRERWRSALRQTNEKGRVPIQRFVLEVEELQEGRWLDVDGNIAPTPIEVWRLNMPPIAGSVAVPTIFKCVGGT